MTQNIMALALGVEKLIETRLAEYKKDRGHLPAGIHLTEDTAIVLADELSPPEVPRTGPDGARLSIKGGLFHGVMLYCCATKNCKTPDAFIGRDGQLEVI